MCVDLHMLFTIDKITFDGWLMLITSQWIIWIITGFFYEQKYVRITQ